MDRKLLTKPPLPDAHAYVTQARVAAQIVRAVAEYSAATGGDGKWPAFAGAMAKRMPRLKITAIVHPIRETV